MYTTGVRFTYSIFHILIPAKASYIFRFNPASRSSPSLSVLFVHSRRCFLVVCDLPIRFSLSTHVSSFSTSFDRSSQQTPLAFPVWLSSRKVPKTFYVPGGKCFFRVINSCTLTPPFLMIRMSVGFFAADRKARHEDSSLTFWELEKQEAT
jgi:hypothetical protein